MLKRRLLREVLLVVFLSVVVVGCLSLGKALSVQEKLFVCITQGGLLVFSIIVLLFERSKRRRLLATRPLVNMQERVVQYATSDGWSEERVVAAWQVIADVLGVDHDQLRPDDALQTLFPLPRWLYPCEWGDAGYLVTLVDQAVAQGAPRPEHLETIDDFLRFFVKYPPAIKASSHSVWRSPIPS